MKPYFQRRRHRNKSDIAQEVADIAQEMPISKSIDLLASLLIC